MPLNFNDGDAEQALDPQQHTDRWRYSVASGCAVSPGTNDLTVQCDAGEVIFDGDTVDVAAQDNVALDAADATHPRKDTVWIDGTGTLQVTAGTAEEPAPAGYDHWRAYRPAPPDLSATAAVVLAEVWVPAGAADITAGDIRDRQLMSDLAVASVTADQINSVHTPQTATELSDAISAVNADGGGTIVLPEAPWIQNELDVSGITPLSFTTDHVAIVGQGRTQSVLKAPGVTSDVIQFTSTEYDNSYLANFSVRGNEGNAIRLKDWHGLAFNVYAQPAGPTADTNNNITNAWHLTDCQSVTMFRCKGENAHTNWRWDNDTETNNNARMIQCESSSNVAARAMEVEGTGRQFEVRGGLWINSEAEHMRFSGVNHPMVMGVKVELGDNSGTGGIPLIKFSDDAAGNRASNPIVAFNELNGSSNAAGNVDRGIQIDTTDGGYIVANNFRNLTNYDIFDGGTVTDLQVAEQADWSSATNKMLGNGTRSRYLGVIGGGPIGGVDLGTTTGQFVGDEAMSDGTTGTAYLHARWTGTGWQQSDGSAVI